ncbi:MAG: protein-disulfide reductase DsbD domain-containing protein [Beijerinckiaceae bacterium]
MSTNRRQLLLGLAAFGGAGFPRVAAAAESAWSQAIHAALRLIASGPVAPGEPALAAIAIKMDEGFKTYWRHPGDSGVPPMFDFAGSRNLAGISVLFPAPQRFADGAGGQSIGYMDREVLLPVAFRIVDPTKPASLKLKADYAICSNICVPVKGEAEIALPLSSSRHAPAILAARSAVPRPVALAASGERALLALGRGGGGEQFHIDVRWPAGEPAPELFIEAEDPWFLEVKSFARLENPGYGRFTVTVLERSKAPDCLDVGLTLTLVGNNAAIETQTRLDVALIAP